MLVFKRVLEGDTWCHKWEPIMLVSSLCSLALEDYDTFDCILMLLHCWCAVTVTPMRSTAQRVLSTVCSVLVMVPVTGIEQVLVDTWPDPWYLPRHQLPCSVHW